MFFWKLHFLWIICAGDIFNPAPLPLKDSFGMHSDLRWTCKTWKKLQVSLKCRINLNSEIDNCTSSSLIAKCYLLSSPSLLTYSDLFMPNCQFTFPPSSMVGISKLCRILIKLSLDSSVNLIQGHQGKAFCFTTGCTLCTSSKRNILFAYRKSSSDLSPLGMNNSPDLGRETAVISKSLTALSQSVLKPLFPLI